MSRVLVTGGSGFIGSHVVDKLAEAGHEPVIFDLRHSPYHESNSVETVVGDLFDEGALRRAMEGCEAVVHLAAYADVGIVAEQPTDAEACNARGTLAVLEAARATGARVLYGSTIWVYGASEEAVIDEESSLGLPDHLYTATKLAGEMYCSSYAELYEVPCTILRFGIPYGPRARPAAVIPTFVSKALAGEPLTIAGDGLQTRRFVYVEDLADGVVAALDNGAPNRTYNLAGEETVTIRELADVVADTVGDTQIVHTPGRNGDFGGAVISSERAAQELGWRASTPLREGVRRYLAWLNPEPVHEPVPEPAAKPATSLRPTWPDLSVVGLSCVLGTLIPSMLAARTDDFGTGQVGYVAVTCLILSLAALCLLPLDSRGRPARGGMLAGWLIAAYVALETLPWPRHLLQLGVPQRGTVVLSLMGLAVALALATATVRLSRGREAARDLAG